MRLAAKKAKQDSVVQKHLTGIDHLSSEDINKLLSLSSNYVRLIEEEKVPGDLLKGKIVLNLFFENSTRTRVSFEMAALRLGAQIVNWDVDKSSLTKGEGFLDTVLTLNAMKPDAIIIRHSEYGAPEFIAQRVDCPVINAGDSWREHPTQALLDALTMQQVKGTLEGLNVAICGDIAHSRVAASNMILLTKMGANVRIIAPPALMPEKLPAENIEKYTSMEEGLKDCDIIMMLRVQRERMESGLIGSDTEYFNQYGLTAERLSLARPDAYVMHPGPVNRGVEIADEIVDDPKRSLILKQVENGVPVRMAVLDYLLCKRRVSSE